MHTKHAPCPRQDSHTQISAHKAWVTQNDPAPQNMSEIKKENKHHWTVVSNFPEAQDEFCSQPAASCSINSIARITTSMDSFDPNTITEQLKEKK